MLERTWIAASVIALIAFPYDAVAQTVRFVNSNSTSVELHIRNGPVNTHPDNRGSRNTTMRAGEVFEDDVGDGDTWFAYGNKVVSTNDNPPLCNVAGGTTVRLDKSQKCFVDN